VRFWYVNNGLKPKAMYIPAKIESNKSEDLNIKGMVKNHNLAKAISDVSWSEFTRQLRYKAQWNDRIYHKIDPWYASSQLCSGCGCQNKEAKCLSIREWVCSECGSTHQRDENAAQNILKQGLRELDISA